jgi:aspartyl-tRNA(Asn)/glutamyl-tRNA(Gln) amidotransferase subunit A
MGVGLPTTHIRTLRLGRPSLRGFPDLDAHVVAAFENAASLLEKAGAQIVQMDLPDISEINEVSQFLPIELIGRLGRRRIQAVRKEIDPVPMARLEAKMDAADYIQLLDRRARLGSAVQSSMAKAGLDGWISPAVPHTATPLDDLKTVDDAAKWNARTFQFTRFANILEQVGISIPLRFDPTGMPIGLQICSPHGKELELLSMSIVIENCLSSDRT